MNKILVINLGSTSTKIAVYDDLYEVYNESISHSKKDLSGFKDNKEQLEFRKKEILKSLKENGFEMKDFDAITSRGGQVRPISGGIYYINEEMKRDAESSKYGFHPTNLGVIIAYDFAKKLGIPAFTVDPPSVDELSNLARYSGTKEIVRKGSFHALNHKRTARKASEILAKPYNQLNLIVVHLGGGISVGAHEKGLIVDVNNALDGDGPFSTERSGGLPVADLISMCYSHKFNKSDMMTRVKGENAGLMSYLGTNSGLEVEDRIKSGDEYAKEVFEAMAYQVSKEIAGLSAVLKGEVDAIVLTGSLAYSEIFVNWIKERVEFIAQIIVLAGENEMLSLCEGANRALNGEEEVKVY